MKERGIIFNAEMVKALLDGRKTQTRRPLKCDADMVCQNSDYEGGAWPVDPNTDDWMVCPFGKVGDRLFMQEEFYIDDVFLIDTNFEKQPARFDPDSLYYRASGDCCEQIPECCCSEVGKPEWRAGKEMPRWASRITLEITDVRVERVQEITEEDAAAEGFKYIGWVPSYNDPDSGGDGTESFPSEKFRDIWNSIYNNWDDNPWVWVLEFKVVD